MPMTPRNPWRTSPGRGLDAVAQPLLCSRIAKPLAPQYLRPRAAALATRFLLPPRSAPTPEKAKTVRIPHPGGLQNP